MPRVAVGAEPGRVPRLTSGPPWTNWADPAEPCASGLCPPSGTSEPSKSPAPLAQRAELPLFRRDQVSIEVAFCNHLHPFFLGKLLVY